MARHILPDAKSNIPDRTLVQKIPMYENHQVFVLKLMYYLTLFISDPALGERNENTQGLRRQVRSAEPRNDYHNHSVRGHGSLRVPAVRRRRAGEHHAEPAIRN